MSTPVKPNRGILGEGAALLDVEMPVEGVSKKCSKCGEVKGLEAFSIDKKGCARGQCRPCCAAAQADRYRRDREAISCRRRADHEANPEKQRAAQKNAYATNPEKAKARAKRGRVGYLARITADPERSASRREAKRAADRARRAADPEKARAAARARHAARDALKRS